MGVIGLDETVSKDDAASQMWREVHSFDSQSTLRLSQNGDFQNVEFRGQSILISSDGESQIWILVQVVAIDGRWEFGSDWCDEFSGSNDH